MHDLPNIKERMKVIYDVLDHAFMLYEEDRNMIDFFKKHEFRCVIVPFIPTTTNIAKWCYEKLSLSLGDSIKIDAIRLYDTPRSWVDYRPRPDTK